MFARFRARLTYANVIATLALFIALGGSSYAALKLPKGSVGSEQLQKNSVTSVKVRPGTLMTSDFNASARSRLRGPEGPEGEEGLEGPEGPAGEPGPTEGFAVGAEPDAVPDQVNASEMFTTTTSGTLYITGRLRSSTTCSAGGNLKVSLYLDGAPVAASGFTHASGVDTRVTTFGLSDSVPAGDHTVSMATHCATGSVSRPAVSDAAFGVILLGES
jgi:hypothetical protein